MIEAGRVDEGIRELETATRLDRNVQALAQKGWAYARAGRADDARSVLAQIEKRVRDEGVFYPDYDVATIHIVLGDRPSAFKHLARALDSGSEALMWAGVDPRIDLLRRDPRLVALLRSAGLIVRRADPPTTTRAAMPRAGRG